MGPAKARAIWFENGQRTACAGEIRRCHFERGESRASVTRQQLTKRCRCARSSALGLRHIFAFAVATAKTSTTLERWTKAERNKFS